jgi:hypothetical protein
VEHPKVLTEFFEPNQYRDSTIPTFIKSFIKNHINSFKQLDSISYNSFCTANELKTKDSQNINNYFSIEIIHRLLTSKTSENGSVVDILNIPYYWHWVNPNPRHEIYQVNTNRRLNELKTLSIYPKYRSFADIDRTPFLFLTDLFDDYPKYQSSLCDSFSTFGWCSEREMSFIYLMEQIGFQGKVIAENNHSWSILKVPMTDNSNQQKIFKVKVDNTFDQIIWNDLTNDDNLLWSLYFGNAPLARWYNSQAHSQNEISKLGRRKISPSAIKHIEESTIKYLRKQAIE